MTGCLLIIMAASAQNLLINGDFSYSNLSGWTAVNGTNGTDGAESGTVVYLYDDDQLAHLHGDGSLYQKVAIQGGDSYACSVHFKSLTVKQTTGYGYAFESGTPLNFGTLKIGASSLNGVCENNNGAWIGLPSSETSDYTANFSFVAPEDAKAVYICIGTKGAIADLKVNAVNLKRVISNEVVLTIKSSSGTALPDAEVTVSEINKTYITDANGQATLSLATSENAYNLSIQCDYYQELKTQLRVEEQTSTASFTLDDMVEVKNVETRISSYMDNATPYPLYGHFWNSGLDYNTQQMEVITDAFDYIIGGGGTPRNAAKTDQLHQMNQDFQVIRYTGGWEMGHLSAEKDKINLPYYRCGSLSSDITASSTSFTVNAPPTNKGKGLMASETGKFDIWIRLGNELMKVTSISSTTSYPITVTVERAYDGSTASTHKQGTTVTLPLYCQAPVAGTTSNNRTYFATNKGVRFQKTLDELFDVMDNYNEDGIWIDILTGRLNASSLYDNKYEEWDHETETLLSSKKEMANNKDAIAALFEKYYARRGYYPVIYGNNVLYSKSLNESQRAHIMVKTEDHPKVLDGFCHENSWGHMSSDDSGIDHEGQTEVKDNKVIEYGTDGKFIEWYIDDLWISNNKAIALLADNQLPNQPMTINAGFKNQWFAENLTDDQRYRFNKYAYASYLMCVKVDADNKISCRMGISPQVKNGGNVSVNVEPFFYYDIGMPVDNYTSANFTKYRYNNTNLYYRQFSNGIVLINPFKDGMTSSIALSEITGNSTEYLNPEDNNTSITSVQLASRQAMFLLTADALNIDQKNAKQVKVYPTFVETELTLELPDDTRSYTIEIQNMCGQLVQQTVVNKHISSLNVANLRQGVYLLRINELDTVFKFIKK